VTFPQLFCLQRRHVGHPNFGPWGLANRIRPLSAQCLVMRCSGRHGATKLIRKINVSLGVGAGGFWTGIEHLSEIFSARSPN
jgi:hypothetical protein